MLEIKDLKNWEARIHQINNKIYSKKKWLKINKMHKW